MKNTGDLKKFLRELAVPDTSVPPELPDTMEVEVFPVTVGMIRKARQLLEELLREEDTPKS